jgi:cupin superfamily acireductone dioxygenase involved in methionine salvage
MIPTSAHIVRSYIVSGETAYQGEPVLLIQRADSIHAHGEGAQQQHRVTLDVIGTGNAIYYVIPKDGHVVRINTGQDLDLAITASGKIHRFKQSSKQEFNLVR